MIKWIYILSNAVDCIGQTKIWDDRSVWNMSTNVYAKFHWAALHIKKALGIFRELIPKTTRRTTRVAFWDPPSGSKKPQHFEQLTIFGTDVVDAVIQRRCHPAVNLVWGCHSLKRMLLLPASKNGKNVIPLTNLVTTVTNICCRESAILHELQLQQPVTNLGLLSQ